MSGIIIPVVQKRTFEYSYLSGTGTQDVVLHPGVDVSAWYYAKILVLVHKIDAVSGSFAVRLQHSFPTDDDRQEFVISSSDFLAVSSISSASPNIKASSTGSDPHAYLKMLLTATQGTGGDRLYGEFSVYLVLRGS